MLFMSLHHVSSKNSKNTKHRHILLTGTEKSFFQKIFSLEKQILKFFDVSENLQENKEKTIFLVYFGSLEVNYK